MKYKCYLPCRGEFGWLIGTFVKKFHADTSTNKIICCKIGHDCLYPTAIKFYYDWQDIPDEQKAGIVQVPDEEEISKKIAEWLPNDEIEFISISEVGWHNKYDFAKYTFIPQSKHNLGLKTDIVITPRNRKIDINRNWAQQNWQSVVNGLNSLKITVGICGDRDTSYDLTGITCRSYDHIDVDSDVEMMNNAKLVVTQETGLQYLSFLCKRPTFCIGHYQGGELHRDIAVPFKELTNVVDNPQLLVEEIAHFLESQK
jgi:hypothetical protein